MVELSDSFSDEVSDAEGSDAEPGATVMWFGMHEGTPLDRLEEGYRRCLLNLSIEKPSRNVSGGYHLLLCDPHALTVCTVD